MLDVVVAGSHDDNVDDNDDSDLDAARCLLIIYVISL